MTKTKKMTAEKFIASIKAERELLPSDIWSREYGDNDDWTATGRWVVARAVRDQQEKKLLGAIAKHFGSRLKDDKIDGVSVRIGVDINHSGGYSRGPGDNISAKVRADWHGKTRVFPFGKNGFNLPKIIAAIEEEVRIQIARQEASDRKRAAEEVGEREYKRLSKRFPWADLFYDRDKVTLKMELSGEQMELVLKAIGPLLEKS